MTLKLLSCSSQDSVCWEDGLVWTMRWAAEQLKSHSWVTCQSPRAACYYWPLTFDPWPPDPWPLTLDIWPLTSDLWFLTPDLWPLTLDLCPWPLNFDIWPWHFALDQALETHPCTGIPNMFLTPLAFQACFPWGRTIIGCSSTIPGLLSGMPGGFPAPSRHAQACMPLWDWVFPQPKKKKIIGCCSGIPPTCPSCGIPSMLPMPSDTF